MHIVQKKILEVAMKMDIAQLGYRKLGAVIGIDHPQKVKWHLEKLIRDGQLVRTADGRPVPPDKQQLFSNMLRIPILGRANCGEPLAFAEATHDDYIQLSRGCLTSSEPNNCFAVRVIGQSMNQSNIQGQPINDGDIVIVDSTTDAPDNGDVVLVSIDGLATIKHFRFNPERRRITLSAQSTQKFNPILLHESDKDTYKIHGKVIDVIPMGA